MNQKLNGMHIFYVTTSFTFKTGSKFTPPRISGVGLPDGRHLYTASFVG